MVILRQTILAAIAVAGLTAMAETVSLNGTDYEINTIENRILSPGVEYRRLRLPDYPLNVHLLTVDMTNPACEVETWVANNSAKSVEHITSAAQRLSSPGHTAVAGANANFWIVASQKEYPVYSMMTRGASLCNGMPVSQFENWDGGPRRCGIVAVTDDRRVLVDYCTKGDTVSWGSGTRMIINMVNKGVKATGNGELCMYNRFYGNDRRFLFVTEGKDSSGTTKIIEEDASDATEVLLDAEPDQEYKSNHDIVYVVKSVRTDAPAGTLGDHDLALVARGGKTAKLAKLKVGTRVKLNCKFTIDPDGARLTPSVVQAVSGNAIVMRNGILTEHNSNEDYNSMVYSRTGYGCSTDNRTLYIIVIDKSTDPDYGRSAGCNTATMCQLAAHYGCSNLANFDAGGSAQMMVDGKIANKTTESSPRKLANGLLIFSTEVAGVGSTIVADSEGKAEEWFTLEGIRLEAKPTEKGIYLLRQGSRTQKIAVK